VKNEIDKDYYCTCYRDDKPDYWDCCCTTYDCENYHRKHPTPEQYKEEYGEDVPDDKAVYYQQFTKICDYENGEIKNPRLSEPEWRTALYWEVKQPYEDGQFKIGLVIIACTPFGAPPDDWRPEEIGKCVKG
jgi:hypothetical protein